MNDHLSLRERIYDLCEKVINEVLTSAENMSGTIIAAAAFGGFCLFIYNVISYYRNGNHDLLSIEHILTIILIVVSLFLLPILGVVFVGLYGITNHIAAWQIGLTTPLIIESAYFQYAKKAKKGEYHNQFNAVEEGA